MPPNLTELYTFTESMIEDERTLLLQMPLYQRLFMASVIILSTIWNSLTKIFIYYHISKEKLTDRPINVLILLDQMIQHIFTTVIAFGMVIKV